ncbi:MAG: T9SS type A sorting domain-containing protein [Saprospirales bacterium]|nr:T9SS type A sorting domain-containing protein [Saprospirales bacterium]
MKNNHYLYFCALFCFLWISSLQSQTWLADGQTWEYDVTGGWDPSGYGKLILQVEGDSTVQGVPCKRLVHYFPNSTKQVVYTYEEQEKVYVYDPYTHVFEKIYDFTLVPGDTVFFQWGRKYVIDSVGVAQIAGANRKFQRIQLYGNSLDSGIYLVVEGLGLVSKVDSSLPENDCIFFFLQYSFCDEAVDGRSYRFRCFSDGSNTYDPYGLCTLNGVSEVQKDEELHVFPNPAESAFTIRLGEETAETGLLTLFDQTGRVIWQGEKTLPATISTEQWPAGSYYILFKDKNATVRGRVMVQ